MTYETYQMLSYLSAALAALALLFSIVFFLRDHIPSVIGDLSGSTAKKAIDEIRRQNAGTGNKAFKPSKVNRARGMITDRIDDTGLQAETKIEASNVTPGTQKFATGELPVMASEGTTVLAMASDGNTAFPDPQTSAPYAQAAEETTLLQLNTQETTVLQSFSQETTVLSADGAGEQFFSFPRGNAQLEIEEEIIMTHSNERIGFSGDEIV